MSEPNTAREVLREARWRAAEEHSVREAKYIDGSTLVVCRCGEGVAGESWGEHVEDAALDALLAHPDALLAEMGYEQVGWLCTWDDPGRCSWEKPAQWLSETKSVQPDVLHAPAFARVPVPEPSEGETT